MIKLNRPVGIAFETTNGLTGMMRDIFLRLINLMDCFSEKIRAIMGMCQEYFVWRKHTYFVKIRKTYLRIHFLPYPSETDGCTITSTQSGINFSFLFAFWRAVLLKEIITQGVYRWTVQIKFGKEGGGQFCIGVLNYPELLLRFIHLDQSKIDHSYDSVCGLRISPRTQLINVKEEDLNQTGLVQDNDVVAVEVDSSAQTLSFFVNNRKDPRVIAGVPLANLMMSVIGRYDKPSFTSLSLRRLPSPTLSTVTCTIYTHKYENLEDIRDGYPIDDGL